MKNLLIGFITITILYTLITHEDKPKLDERVKYKPVHSDPTREVYRFDWENNKFIYQDEVDHSPYKGGNSDAMQPDYVVQSWDSYKGNTSKNSSIDENTIYIIDGKRYKLRKLSNNRTQLIEL